MKKHKSIFMLESIILSARQEKQSICQFKTFRLHCGTFSTVKKAENAMKKANADDQCIGYVLTEHWLDAPFYRYAMCNNCKGRDGEFSEFKSIRTYLRDGALNYCMPFDDCYEKKFKGTKCSGRFNCGDLAWRYDSYDECMELTLVEKEPYSRDEWKKHFDKHMHGDYSDDSCLNFIVGCKGHTHDLAVMLFPLSCIKCNICKKTIKELMSRRKTWLKTGV